MNGLSVVCQAVGVIDDSDVIDDILDGAHSGALDDVLEGALNDVLNCILALLHSV